MAQWKNICGSNLAHGRLHRRGYCIRHTRLRPRRPLLVCSGQPVPPWAHWYPTIGWKMRQSWDAGRKWGTRLWKVEIRDVAHRGLMTSSLPEARLSPPAQPKQKQIIVFKCDRSSVNILSYAKEIVIMDNMVNQFNHLWHESSSSCFYWHSQERPPHPPPANLFCTFSSTINMWRLGENDVRGELSFRGGWGLKRNWLRLNHRKPCNINSEWLYV